MATTSNTIGRIIMFDGPDGIGKTTQLKLVAEDLEKDGYTVFKSKTHGGSPIGDALRAVSLSDYDRTPLTDMYISLAMHSELSGIFNEKRDRGAIVLVDRSPLSIVAYQSFGSGLDRDFTFDIVDMDLQFFRPNLIIVYQAPLEVSNARMQARNEQDHTKKEYFESKPADYFVRVAEGYAAAAARFNAEVIKADSDVMGVHNRTMKVIKKILT